MVESRNPCREKLKSDYSYCFRLHGNDLTAENTEDTEGENRDLNNSDGTGLDIISPYKGEVAVNYQLSTINCQLSTVNCQLSTDYPLAPVIV
ncbi:MAG: hypothetical protein JGK01_20295 [Microcoleus sp. PH2017_03_ELD_O_A]|nr:hypothetical protein [Microcoleus sp. PH2017_03_ELD_O_A]